jgi:hypothetical protein
MSKAAVPTAFIVMEATRNGKMPPINMPISTVGFEISSEKPGL